MWKVKAVFGEDLSVPSRKLVEQKPEGELLQEVKVIFGDDLLVERKKPFREKLMSFFQ